MPHTNNKDNKRKYPNSKSGTPSKSPSFSKKPSNNKNKPDKKKQKTALSYNDTRKIKEIAFDADSR
eukprot:CAMPEP_0182513108 /NCGR_PEP_ID=MMETSP1321-20130603/33398_1 /TAXON_ID=91990 /ORGANISM="Bolidomonas sp., Strain RCC1657" /LENGTH=65 /DNA_ID=CAMNT_0024720059 /DNA_START=91 /DNA_END=284 /DNA_ORIENTATION=+